MLINRNKSFATILFRVRRHAQWHVACGWFVAATTGFLVIFGPRNMYMDTHVYDKLEASFYAGFHRQVFALAISWIVFCCAHGYAGNRY